ncbi:MAG: alpha/beta fold hydrolase [Caldilineaceae bacterium]|nr:alpha/beta fold hydrolase [Caldilineaceae bacterium]
MDQTKNITLTSVESTANAAAALFRPHFLVRHGDVQTFLAMVQTSQALDVIQGEQAVILDAGTDKTGVDPDRSVRLLAYYTPQRSDSPRRGLVLTLHGWEGCSHSNYNLLLGSGLIRAGYDVVRLNMRDHGFTHHLNKGLFYSTLIEEVAAAVEQVAGWAGEDPFYVVGASLGGSFALRLAIRWDLARYPNLRRVIAINPAINPNRTADVLDRHPVYRHYFRTRWLASLRRKEELFPDLYDFAEVARIPSVRGMTEWLIPRYSSYRDARHYFDSYAVTSADLRDLALPVTIITAANDPIISAQDFQVLERHPLLDVQIHPSGGHVGFADLFPFRHTLPQLVLEQVAGSR